MIIIDFSGISVSNIFVAHANKELTLEHLRHMTLNSICMYNKKFKKNFGHVMIACDHGNWRKEIYPQYKANRAEGREASPIDWVETFGWLDIIKEELDKHSPWTVLDVPNTEADDVIATLCIDSQEFGQCEEIMIVSSDKDFKQLQRFSNVHQFSSIMKKHIVEKDARHFLFEQIVRGDAADGVPNIFSGDDVLVTKGVRQTPVSKKKLELLYESFLRGEIAFEKEEHRRNFDRNKKMIDLGQIPADTVKNIQAVITKQDKRSRPLNKNAFLTYLIKNRCNHFIERLPEFF